MGSCSPWDKESKHVEAHKGHMEDTWKTHGEHMEDISNATLLVTWRLAHARRVAGGNRLGLLVGESTNQGYG